MIFKVGNTKCKLSKMYTRNGFQLYASLCCLPSPLRMVVFFSSQGIWFVIQVEASSSSGSISLATSSRVHATPATEGMGGDGFENLLSSRVAAARSVKVS